MRKYNLIRIQFLLAATIFLFGTTADASPSPKDPFLWLESLNSKKVQSWVRRQNAATIDALTHDPIFSEVERRFKGAIERSWKVQFANYELGYFWQILRDQEHPRGVLRRTTLREYQKDDPSWEIIFDTSSFEDEEESDWQLVDYRFIDEAGSRGLVFLSRGGRDAVAGFEIDLNSKKVLPNGFHLPESKTVVQPFDLNTIIVGTNFGEGSLTKSGYPRILKIWRRGESLADAKTIFEGAPDDTRVQPWVVIDRKRAYLLIERSLTFFESEYSIYVQTGLRRIPLPAKSFVVGGSSNFIYARTREEVHLSGSVLTANSIVRIPTDATSMNELELVFQPPENSAIENVTILGNQVLVTLLENAKNRILHLRQSQSGRWIAKNLLFPKSSSIEVQWSFDGISKLSTAQVENYLRPPTQYMVRFSAGEIKLTPIKAKPASIDRRPFEVIPLEATSADGTRIPYSVVKRKGLALDGSNPTILYGYGGFEVSLKPQYLSVRDAAWVDLGGIYVTANVRGGGEFGPDWHQAALKEKRQNSFDDFAAVAQDLIARGLTTPEHLGIVGASNGGLLTGATLVQYPHLFNAALIQVPLLDMIRYTHLLVGASWIAEYGDPANPVECEHLLRISPYHNVKQNKAYPKPFIMTSTADDRVHPAHARKMTALMKEQGHEVLFYESETGGHQSKGNLDAIAHEKALEFTYLWQQLK